MGQRSKSHRPKSSQQKRQKLLAKKSRERQMSKPPSLISPGALAEAHERTKRIQKREAASMQRLLDSERITEKDLQVTINARG